MRCGKLFFLLFISLCFMGRACFAQEDPNEILQKVDANLMPENFVSYRTLINKEPDGAKKEYKFFIIKKGDNKVAMLYLSPASEKGKSSLRLGNNLWLYLPKVRKPVRITSMQSIVGGIFNNSDIMRLDFHVEYNAVILKKNLKEYIFELKAKNKYVAYSTLKMWVDKTTLLPIKIECFGASGMLIKTLEYKEAKDFGDGIISPSILETYSPLYKGYRSYLIIDAIEAKTFPSEVFTLDSLPRLEQIM